jgi:hypothetical protein
VLLGRLEERARLRAAEQALEAEQARLQAGRFRRRQAVLGAGSKVWRLQA